MALIGNYQKMLDSRLSKPKSLSKYPQGQGRTEKVFKNSNISDQKLHQSIFANKPRDPSPLGGEPELEAKTFDDRLVTHLNNSMYSNFRQKPMVPNAPAK
uniref:Uncharacterized protein n=1 Tax=Strombidium inclinatum TaxID=197538 RepID=A0A7S3IXZ6_9SPIT|mmetsp:Transcript_42736/g.65642  ORF Transcript_42736/g.65642 Transcript_42736/m.65642 type:complete len:100 (+) Transcript_42736:469-768(+)